MFYLYIEYESKDHYGTAVFNERSPTKYSDTEQTLSGFLTFSFEPLFSIV
jgi:hypothetical protein